MTSQSLVIVGAGIGGLTAAIMGAECGMDGTLVQAGNQVGGAAWAEAVGEASARAAAGVGYNSRYSLSRAMAFGWIAAGHAADAVEAVAA